MSSVQIRDVRKSFGSFEVLHGVTVPIESRYIPISPFCAVVARLKGRDSAPVKTFLNWTMPEFANIKVGSLRGTSGLDGTTAWPCFAKKSRKVRRISLAEVI